MKVFICGGGAGKQTEKALRRLNEVIRHDRPCLYIPLAMEEDKYDSCLEWIRGELAGVDIPGIRMVRSAEELAGARLQDHSFLFLGGGNTFRLMHRIRCAGMFGPIRGYLQNGGAAFGGSAGAIVFGEDLESCALDDTNDAGLADTRGFDVLGGVSFLCHFTNRAPEHDRKSENYLLEISKRRTVYALPEEDTLFVNGTRTEMIGDRPYYVFSDGRKTEVAPDSETYICRIASPEDMELKWNQEILRHPGEKNWTVWKAEAIANAQKGLSIPYYGFLNGKIICEATASLRPFSPQDGKGPDWEGAVELCAFRTVREYRGMGYFSRLKDFMLEDLRRKGYLKAVVGAEPCEEQNTAIYRHWGFDSPAGSGTETYPDGTVISVAFYGKRL